MYPATATEGIPDLPDLLASFASRLCKAMLDRCGFFYYSIIGTTIHSTIPGQGSLAKDPV